jgi:predicted CXXCH cytochrome family protein
MAMVWFLFCLAFYGLNAAELPNQPNPQSPAYVGSPVCAECHQEQMKKWSQSHHAWAWREPTKANVMADFYNTETIHKGISTRFTVEDGKFFAETPGSDGVRRKFEVKGTIGIEPLQQYILETETGRLQALDIAWDTENKRWYQLFPKQKAEPGNGQHWTGPYKNWNGRCAECHATGYEKRYSPRERRFSSRQSEIGVGCEACHGPAAAHVAWGRDSRAFDQSKWAGVNADGFSIKFDQKNAEIELQQCAGCHSRRGTFDDASPMPGTLFHDSYRLALLRDGLYHPDGQIKDEVYVYGSFLQSKMSRRGVRCSNCHDPHSAKLRVSGNALCTQCHNSAGNPDFPSLRLADYDTTKHHFHKAGTEGALCKSCHMIERVYMGVDGRRDHSFRVPRPDLSVAMGTPNACTDCHKDKSAAWAAADLAIRFPDSPHRGAHFGSAIAAARQGKGGAKTADQLADIALSRENAGIVRATALNLLQRYGSQKMATRVAGLLRDADPIVRAAATGPQRAAPMNVRIERVSPLLGDKRKAVRIAAVRTLIDIISAGGSPATTRAGQRGISEYQRSLAANADFPEIQLAIAGTAMVFRNLPVAERAFREATAMDPQLTNAWIMISRLRSAQGDVRGATKALLEGIAANPNDTTLSDALSNVPGLKRLR